MKKLLLFLPLLLAGCAGTPQTLVVKQHTLRDQVTTSSEDPMVHQEKLRRLYGAVTLEERKERLGQYYTILWNSPETAGSQREIRFDYLQGGSGSRIKTMKRPLDIGQAKGKAEFSVIGKNYFDNGRVLAWKISLVVDGKSIASEQSYLWE
jgi:hypothetical protein